MWNGSQEEMTFYIERFITTLESKIPRLLENEYFWNDKWEQRSERLGKITHKPIRADRNNTGIVIDPERTKPTIRIITALPKEYIAIYVLLENKNDEYKIPGQGAGRRYCLGEISSEKGYKHRLVLANADMGNNIAATRAYFFLSTFQMYSTSLTGSGNRLASFRFQNTFLLNV